MKKEGINQSESTSDLIDLKKRFPEFLNELSRILNSGSGVLMEEQLISGKNISPNEIMELALEDSTILFQGMEKYIDELKRFKPSDSGYYHMYYSDSLLFNNILKLLQDNDHILEEIYSKSKNIRLLSIMMSRGLYTEKSISMISDYAKKNEIIQQRYIDIASFEDLKSLLGSKSVDVRLAVYKRLGFKYFKEMLADKSVKVQILGANLMPMYYAVPASFVNSNSPILIQIILNKIPINQLPLFIANKIVRSRRDFQQLLDRRMNSGL